MGDMEKQPHILISRKESAEYAIIPGDANIKVSLSLRFPLGLGDHRQP